MRELPSGGLQKGASSAGWLGGVINKLCAASNKLKMLGFAEGFFEEEISEIIWAKAQSDHRLDYENHRKPLSFELLGLKTPTKKLLEHLTKNSVGLLVFDLGFAAKIKPLINDQSEWQVVEFPHEADFPVGVGFSHSFLPRLLVHDNWKKIGSSVFKNIEPTKAGLKASGISPLEENIYL